MDEETAKRSSQQHVARTPFDGLIKNPFALDDKMLSVHADEAHARTTLNWSCPGCLQLLTLKRSINGRPFFAHRANACGSGYETALHAFAKRIIFEEKRILLPPYKVDGEVTSQARELTFDCVVIETVDERSAAVRMVPDCTLTRGSETLYVEIAVTHWVDERKALKVERGGASMIEVTLCRRKASDMGFDALRDYVLSGAKRVWINNAKHGVHLSRLKRMREMAAQKATMRVHELVRSYKPAQCPDDEIRRYRFLLRKWKLDGLIGFANQYPHWFRFTAEDWQTLYLGQMLFDSADPKRSPGDGETFLLHWFNFRFLGDPEYHVGHEQENIFAGLVTDYRQAPSWFNIELISEVEKGRREYGTGPNGFGNPTLALKSFQEHLRMNGRILRLVEDGRYEIDATLMGEIWRCQRMENLLWRSIPSQNIDFKKRTKDQWLQRVPPGHRGLPEAIAKAGGQGWNELEQDLIETSSLVLSAHPKPIKNLLGLPLFKANELASGRSVDHLRSWR